MKLSYLKDILRMKNKEKMVLETVCDISALYNALYMLQDSETWRFCKRQILLLNWTEWRQLPDKVMCECIYKQLLPCCCGLLASAICVHSPKPVHTIKTSCLWLTNSIPGELWGLVPKNTLERGELGGCVIEWVLSSVQGRNYTQSSRLPVQNLHRNLLISWFTWALVWG